MKVSIIISAFNMIKYIEKAVTSALNQSYKNIEIVIVDDKSTDGTREFLQDFNKRFPQLVIIYHQENKGPGWARQTGINHATGDFIQFLDADDYLSEDYIESLVKTQKSTEADIVSGGVTECYPDGSHVIRDWGNNIINGGKDAINFFFTLKLKFLNNSLINKKLFDLTAYDKARYIEDTPTKIRLYHFTNKIAYCENHGYYYTMNPQSLCHTSNNVKQNIYLARAALKSYYFLKQNNYPTELLLRCKIAAFNSLEKIIDVELEDIKQYL